MSAKKENRDTAAVTESPFRKGGKEKEKKRLTNKERKKYRLHAQLQPPENVETEAR